MVIIIANRYFILAGEASGDQHAAALIAQIKQRDPEAQFAGLGGDCMATEGCNLYRHIRHMAFMGFVAVIRHWRDVSKNFRIAREALLKEQPNVLILIDYPSFNLQMAAFCRKHLPQTKIIYYIPPKVWAWKRRRIHKIAHLCDKVLGIFPFEPAFYAKYGYQCTYVGHPTVEAIESFSQKGMVDSIKEDMIAILPGSRPSEISNCLPRMLEATRRFPNYNIVVCAAPGIKDTFYAPYLQNGEKLARDTYKIVKAAQAAIVNSGTATLETALLGCPQVAVYHLACNWFFTLTRKRLQSFFFSIPYFTPVNIIADKEIIRECLANEFTVDNVAAEVERILTNKAYKKEMLASYQHLCSILGSQSASVTAADIITSIR